MKKFVFFNFLLLLLFGCKDDTNMIKCKGIPALKASVPNVWRAMCQLMCLGMF